jgi:predicted MFS family arabinose efflux permease
MKRLSISTVLLFSCFLGSAALAEQNPPPCSRKGSVALGAVIGALPALVAGIVIMSLPSGSESSEERSETSSVHSGIGIMTMLIGIPIGALFGGVVGYAVSCRSTSASTGTRNNNSLLRDETHLATLRNQQGTPGPRFVLPILSYGF